MPNTIQGPQITDEEKHLSLKELAAKIPSKPTPETVRAWVDEGIIYKPTGKRVYLEKKKIGGRLYSTYEAYERFCKELNS